jgi:hypothetical protein
VTVPAHAPARDIERTVPLRSTSRSGRSHALGGGLRSFDDLLDFDQESAGGRRHRDEDRGFDRRGSGRTEFDPAEFDTADFGWSGADHYRTIRTGAGYHQADLRWDPSDVSHARTRCGGRHRA